MPDLSAPRRVMPILVLVLLLAAMLAGSPARASGSGTPAWALTDLVVHQGPGPAYDILGSIHGEAAIRVERCAPRWCKVRFGRLNGWVSRDHVGFGQEPRGPLTGPRLGIGSGGPGTVCFYEGTHFTGRSVCHRSGFVAPDLLLYGMDNRFASVSVEGNVSAAVCRDRNFQSYCTRIIESTPVLGRYLRRAVSSYRIY